MDRTGFDNFLESFYFLHLPTQATKIDKHTWEIALEFW